MPEEPVEATIESLSDEGRGIAHVDGRAVFVDQALAGERVRFRYSRLTSKIAEGRAVEIIEGADSRVQPGCSAFERCGGCSLQHMQGDAQLALKQQALLKHLGHIGNVEPAHVLEPITGETWGYRSKARLGVRYVAKKDRVLVGFRERGSSFITETQSCEILHPSVGAIISELAESIARLELKRRIPQIEVAVGDDQTVLVFRHLDDMSVHDREILTALAKRHGLTIMLQDGPPNELEPLWPPEVRPLYYVLENFDVRIEFQPGDFTQVNYGINRKMIGRAIELLQLDSGDRVLDLFSGLGNFTLPIATRAGSVVGVEGDAELVRKGTENARRNGIENASFFAADLNEEPAGAPWLKDGYDKVLVDPPRSGAEFILPHIAASGARRLVYVSCHPASLARDAGILVHEHGFALKGAGVMDMFPHTGHVESIALFERKAG